MDMHHIFFSVLYLEVCSLPKEAGPCRNFTVKWFFDVSYGGCSRFWYGGCDGNGNVFATQDECESVCVKPEGPGVVYFKLLQTLYREQIKPMQTRRMQDASAYEIDQIVVMYSLDVKL